MKKAVVFLFFVPYSLIFHSREYINHEDDGKTAIKTILSDGKEYEPFRKYINYLVTNEIEVENGKAKINLEDIYKKENHIDINDEGEERESSAKKLADLLSANHLKLKLTFDKKENKLKLESTLSQAKRTC